MLAVAYIDRLEARDWDGGDPPGRGRRSTCSNLARRPRCRPVDAIVSLDTDDGQIIRVADYWPERAEPIPAREHLTTRF